MARMPTGHLATGASIADVERRVEPKKVTDALELSSSPAGWGSGETDRGAPEDLAGARSS